MTPIMKKKIMRRNRPMGQKTTRAKAPRECSSLTNENAISSSGLFCISVTRHLLLVTCHLLHVTYSLLHIPCFLFPTSCSHFLFPIPYSLLPVPCSLFYLISIDTAPLRLAAGASGILSFFVVRKRYCDWVWTRECLFCVI